MAVVVKVLRFEVGECGDDDGDDDVELAMMRMIKTKM